MRGDVVALAGLAFIYALIVLPVLNARADRRRRGR